MLPAAFPGPRRTTEVPTVKPRLFTHQPALDGVRGLAVLAVMWDHVVKALPQPFRLYGGFQGVDVFFALSGYLITSLFLAEFSRTHRFSFPAFYRRRAVRLLPALALVAVLGFTIASATNFVETKRSVVEISMLVFGFVGNWFSHNNGLGILSHTWSLAIEEQFYLLWPAILLLLLRKKVSRRSIIRTLVVLACIAFTIRLVLMSRGQVDLALFSTFSRTDGILLGCALAIALWREHSAIRQWLAIPAVGAFAGIGLLVFTGWCGHGGMNATMCSAPGGSILGTIFIGHLVVAPAGAAAGLMSLRPLRGAGKISYGLYLIHVPLMVWIFRSFPLSNWEAPVWAALSIGAATVSYFVIERPLIRLHRKHVQRRRTAAEVRPLPQRRLVAA